MNNPKHQSFEYLIGRPIQVITEPFPKQIDILRLYFGQTRSIPDRTKIGVIIKKIEQKYLDGGLQVKSLETIRLKTKRLVTSCKNLIAKRKLYQKSGAEKKRQEFFRDRIQNVFEVAYADIPSTSMFFFYWFRKKYLEAFLLSH